MFVLSRNTRCNLNQTESDFAGAKLNLYGWSTSAKIGGFRCFLSEILLRSRLRTTLLSRV